MPDSSDIADEIAEAAIKPQSATIDGNSVNQHSLRDKIEAAKYLATQEAGIAEVAAPGIRISRIRPTYE